jgi:hypothetical protein
MSTLSMPRNRPVRPPMVKRKRKHIAKSIGAVNLIDPP